MTIPTQKDLAELLSKFKRTIESSRKQIGMRYVKEAQKLLEKNPEEAVSKFEHARMQLPYAEEITKRAKVRLL